METLRSEILESQKARSDLLKWKLVVVAGLGAAGMGFTSGGFKYGQGVLCLIPFACLYVDLLCRHLNLRILVIGQFLKAETPADGASAYIQLYERFSDRLADAYALESWALHWSTIAISLFIAPVGLSIQWPDENASVTALMGWLFGLSGLAGIIFSMWGKTLYEKKRATVISQAGTILAEIKAE